MAQSTMLLLAVAALIMPAIFELVQGTGLPPVGAELVNYDSTVEKLSLATAIVLIGTYVAGLFFSLRTHNATSSIRPTPSRRSTASAGRCAAR